MSTPSPALAAALSGLQSAVDLPLKPGASPSGWRWNVRQRMGAVRQALMDAGTDGWLAARGGTAFDERNALLGRVTEMGTSALELPDPAAVRAEVGRLVADITAHVGRPEH